MLAVAAAPVEPVEELLGVDEATAGAGEPTAAPAQQKPDGVRAETGGRGGLGDGELDAPVHRGRMVEGWPMVRGGRPRAAGPVLRVRRAVSATSCGAGGSSGWGSGSGAKP